MNAKHALYLFIVLSVDFQALSLRIKHQPESQNLYLAAQVYHGQLSATFHNWTSLIRLKSLKDQSNEYKYKMAQIRSVACYHYNLTIIN